jgi:hypothetical protein
MTADPASRSVGDGATQSTATGVPWKSVALPSEHGGWSLTAEPAVLGLAVAWSWPGLALGVAAMVAFVTRTPLKIVLVDQWRHRSLPRTHFAAKIAATELVVFVALVTYAVVEGSSGFLLPLAVAAPLVSIEWWFDMRSRGRRLIPELAGSIGIGSIATAIALADGAPTKLAWGLWVVIAARSLAAIPYVRTQISRTKSRPAPLWHSDLAQLIAVAIAVAATIADIVPVAAAAIIAVLAVVHTSAVRMSPRPAMVIGIQEMVLGVAVIATTVTAIHLA